jgi:PAS domain S-box-containing protein
MTDRYDPRFVRRLSGLCTAASLLAILAGLTSELGRVLHFRISGAWQTTVGLQPGLSICLILMGATLLLLRRLPHSALPPVQKFSAYAAAGLVTVWGLLGLVPRLPGLGPRLDRFLPAAISLQAKSAYGLPLSPISSLSLFLFGFALLILDWRPGRRLWPAQFLCCFGGLASLAMLLNFALSADAPRLAGELPSTFVFAAFSLGAICARPEWGMAGLFASRGLGGTVFRRLFFAAVVIPVLISWVRWRSLEIGLRADWTLITVVSVAVLSGFIVWTATIIERADQERAEATAALQASEEQLRLLLDGVKDYAIYSLDPNGLVASWNEGAKRIKGYHADEILGQHMARFYTAEDVAQGKPQQALSEAVSRGRYETRGVRVRKDGSRFWASIVITPLYDNNGAIRGFSKVLHDVTEHRRIEEALLESKAQLSGIISSAMDAIIAIDDDHRVVLFNPAAEQMFGRSAKEVIGEYLGRLIPARFRARHAQHIRHFGDTGTTNRAMEGLGELLGLHFDGTEFPIEASISQIQQGGKKLFTVIVRDITLRRQAEEALRISESRYRRFVEHNPVGVLRSTLEGEILECNESLVCMFGYASQQELLSCRTPDLHFDSADREMMLRMLRRHKTLSNCEISFRRKDGTALPALASITLVEDEDKGGALEATIIDISERKQIEERLAGQTEEVSRQAEELARSERALRAQTGLLQSVLDSLGEGLIAADSEGKFFLWNPAAKTILGADPANIPPAEWALHYGVFLPDQVTLFPTDQLPLLRAIRGESSEAEIFLRNRKRERAAWIEVSGRPLRSEDGGVRGGVVAFRDVTEAKEAQQEIRKLNDELEQRVRQRTVELETANQELQAFSYSVSHDLRAPLRHISGFSRLLVEQFGPQLEPEAQHYLQRIDEGIRHMGRLVDELLNLARVGRHGLSLQTASLKSIVQEVITTLKPESEEQRVEWKVGDLPLVECDPTLVRQVFQNLLANALKFTRPRERAMVEVSQREANGEPVIMVRDNGVGFNMKYADKLFGVFQRLHRSEDFEGTGVGLATVQRIIQKHGGRVWAEAELDRGATFYFTLGAGAAHPVKAEPTTETVGV